MLDAYTITFPAGVVVTGNICVLVHSKILSFKPIVACSSSFLGSITNEDRSRQSGGNRALFFPWIEYKMKLNHVNCFEGATHLTSLFIVKWSLYIHKRNRILNGTILSPSLRALQIERTVLTSRLKLWLVFCSTSIEMQIFFTLPLDLTKVNKRQIFLELTNNSPMSHYTSIRLKIIQTHELKFIVSIAFSL